MSATSLKPEHLRRVQGLIGEMLEPHAALVESLTAHEERGALHVYALIHPREHHHELGLALGLLEVHLARELEGDYENVVLHLLPLWGLTADERASLQQEGVRLY